MNIEGKICYEDFKLTSYSYLIMILVLFNYHIIYRLGVTVPGNFIALVVSRNKIPLRGGGDSNIIYP